MPNFSKPTVIIAMGVFVSLGVAFSNMPEGGFKNLQILPKDISQQKLDSIMQSYTKALGVTCKFCHVPTKGFNPNGTLDYALDDEPMKSEARKMMRLTIQLNKEYFYYDTLTRPEYLKVVHCNTCHRGEAFPEH